MEFHPQPTPALEATLRRRFEIRDERFVHGTFAVDLLLPAQADALIDESEFDADERLPYWAELWPASRALTRHLLEYPPSEGPVLELGCGIALPSLALHSRGTTVLATDYYADALLFARANAERNGMGTLPTTHLDWREPPGEPGNFPLVIAADVLYEQRNAETLAEALPRLVAEGGEVLLADPGRLYLAEFRTRMRAAGWTIEEWTRAEPSAEAPRGEVDIRMLRVKRVN